MSGIQQTWQKEVLSEINAALADHHLVFQLFQHINERHDQLHYEVLASLDTQLRRAENLPPFSFCWLEMGSGGRSERTFWTDQDNGIVYQCLGEDVPLVENYLHRLAEKAVSTLAEYGYPFCTGLVMANQPRWLASFDGWIKQWNQWGTELTLDAIRCLLISADMRPIYGEAMLTDQLKQWFVDQENQVKWYPRLLHHSTSQQLPLGPFGHLLTERYGNYMGMYHLKEGGYYQLISLVRLLALHAGILATSTKARIEQLCKAQYLTSTEARAWENALSFFLIARLKQHLTLAEAEQPIHDYISLSTYSKVEGQQLKEHISFLKKQQKYWRKLLGAGKGHE
jgi:CBS domain-containing protein